VQNGHQIFLKPPCGNYSKAVLQEGKSFQNNVVAGDKQAVGIKQSYPGLFCAAVILIVSVKQRKKGGRIDEDLHFLYASARYLS
jgi:hypothetical protein